MMNPYPNETIRQIVAGERGGVPVLPPYTGGDMNAPPPKRKQSDLEKWIDRILKAIPILGGPAVALPPGQADPAIEAGKKKLEEALGPEKSKQIGEAAREGKLGEALNIGAGSELGTYWLVNGLLVIALVMGGLMLLQQAIPTPVGRLPK